MNINITVTASPELMAVLESFAVALTGTRLNGEAKTAMGAPAVNGTVKNKSVKAVKEPALVPAIDQDEEAETATENTPKMVTVEKVRELVAAAASSGKRSGVKALLTEFGADNVTSLDQEHYVAFIDKLNDL